MTVALIVAAGRGTRATGTAAPKQYVPIGGRPMLAHTLDVFLSHSGIDGVGVVIHQDDVELYRETVATCRNTERGTLLPAVHGGATRQASVLSGLRALVPLEPARVLIHDAARPFVDHATIDRVLAALETSPGAIAAERVTDTLKRDDGEGRIAATVERAGMWRAQTPQGFRFADILAAHERAALIRDTFTDDASIAEWAGLSVQLVEGSAANVKLTTAEDIAMADARLAAGPAIDIRTGQGFDVHRFTEGDHVWLGGVKIPHTHALDGHSDADVVMHALTDALLGTIGDGDIGQHFPPSDPQWRGAASHMFLTDARRRVEARHGRIMNVDITILCEAPRIGPHRVDMQLRIAELLGLGIDRVGVKATTTEKLGFTGRREGIAAMAIATVDLSRW